MNGEGPQRNLLLNKGNSEGFNSRGVKKARHNNTGKKKSNNNKLTKVQEEKAEVHINPPVVS